MVVRNIFAPFTKLVTGHIATAIYKSCRKQKVAASRQHKQFRYLTFVSVRTVFTFSSGTSNTSKEIIDMFLLIP